MRTLKTLTAVQLASIQSAYSVLTGKEMRLRGNLAQLVKDKQQTAERNNPDDAAHIAGAEIRWHKWVDERRAKINVELAQVLSQKLECQRKLRRAFGKDQALDALLKQQQILAVKRHANRQL